MPDPTDDFTPGELEFLKWFWVWDLAERGWNINLELRHALLERIKALK